MTGVVSGSDRSAPNPVFHIEGGRCDACTYLYFPYQPYGCDRCGAGGDHLQRLPLDCAGTIEGSAVVHNRPRDGGQIPVGEIRLRSGVLIRALLAADLPIGTSVVGRPAPERPGGVVFGAMDNAS